MFCCLAKFMLCNQSEFPSDCLELLHQFAELATFTFILNKHAGKFSVLPGYSLKV